MLLLHCIEEIPRFASYLNENQLNQLNEYRFHLTQHLVRVMMVPY